MTSKIGKVTLERRMPYLAHKSRSNILLLEHNFTFNWSKFKELCSSPVDVLCKSGEVFLSWKQIYMTKRSDFTKEFEREAVRHTETSGQTRKVDAEDLGIDLSTLTRWLSRNRETGMLDPSHRKSEQDMAPIFAKIPLIAAFFVQEPDRVFHHIWFSIPACHRGLNSRQRGGADNCRSTVLDAS